MENASLRDELVEPVSKSAELAAQPLETNNEGGQRPTSEESSPASRPLPPPPPPKRFKPSTDCKSERRAERKGKANGNLVFVLVYHFCADGISDKFLCIRFFPCFFCLSGR